MNDLKLNEILWECTLWCQKGCSYCGSKDILRKEHDEEHILNIARKIAEYPPLELVLTGGEPGMVSEDTLKEIREIFKDLKLKVVTNGLVIINGLDKYFDWVGISVNTVSDVLDWKEYEKPIQRNLTIITNFGRHNVFDFDKIESLVKDLNVTWQIQLTEGPELLNEDGIKFLFEKIKGSLTKGISVVKADNLQEQHTCRAGFNSCGITYDGDVIPCLSMRSWKQDAISVAGNLTTDSLKDSWESGFRDRRFGDCTESCRDCVKFPVPDPASILTDLWKNPPNTPVPITITPQPSIQLYGVTSEPSSYVYGVVTDRTTTGNKPNPNHMNPYDDNDPFGGVMIYGVEG